MNRKKKINDLYKGVFKNDKKSCLVDLKPLDNQQGINRPNSPVKQINNPNLIPNNISNLNQAYKRKEIDISLKVAKNLGFGSYFQNLREEIIDIFLNKEDLISFEGLFNPNGVSDLFNFKENLQNSSSDYWARSSLNNNCKNSNNNYTNNTSLLNQLNQSTNSTDQEVILYEDEEKTIYKRKKLKSKMTKEYEQAISSRCLPKKKENLNNVNQANNNSYYFNPYPNNSNLNNVNANVNLLYSSNDNTFGISKELCTPDKTHFNHNNNFTRNSVLFMNKITNCKKINGNYVSIPNISYNENYN